MNRHRILARGLDRDDLALAFDRIRLVGQVHADRKAIATHSKYTHKPRKCRKTYESYGRVLGRIAQRPACR